MGSDGNNKKQLTDTLRAFEYGARLAAAHVP